MKNILGTTEDLKLYDEDHNCIYQFYKEATSFSKTKDSVEFTYDSNGNELTYKNSNGSFHKFTYDSDLIELVHKDLKDLKLYDEDQNCVFAL